MSATLATFPAPAPPKRPRVRLPGEVVVDQKAIREALAVMGGRR